MEKPKIVIVVRGGIVQQVNANMDVDIAVIDYDNQSEEDDGVSISSPDTIREDIIKVLKEGSIERKVLERNNF